MSPTQTVQGVWDADTSVGSICQKEGAAEGRADAWSPHQTAISFMLRSHAADFGCSAASVCCQTACLVMVVT